MPAGADTAQQFWKRSKNPQLVFCKHSWNTKIMDYSTTVDIIGKTIDMIGVATIVFGILFSLILFLLHSIKTESKISPYGVMRQTLGKTIVIGL